jgi:hypothetical protein
MGRRDRIAGSPGGRASGRNEASPLAAGSAATATRSPGVSPAPDQPPWGKVIAGTLRLWLRRHLSGRVRRGRGPAPLPWRIAAALIVAAALFIAGAVTGYAVRPGRPAEASPDPAPRPDLAGAVAAAAAARAAAASWVEQQVSPAAMVACDPVMCAALQADGFPAADLVSTTPGSADPLGSALIIATAAVRSQFGARLPDVWAPVVVAAFGSGAARVEIRAYGAGSAATYRAALADDLAARRSAGRQLLRNRRFAAAGPARQDLAAGRVDSRLLITLAELTPSRAVSVAAFGDAGPGADPQLPLRWAVLTVPPHVADPVAYLQSLVGFLRTQLPPVQPARVRVTGTGSRALVQIEFYAPTPLGLLEPAGP